MDFNWAHALMNLRIREKALLLNSTKKISEQARAGGDTNISLTGMLFRD